MSAGAAAMAGKAASQVSQAAATVLPSTARLRFPLKKQYYIPLIRARPKGKNHIRRTPLLTTRVKSPSYPKRYAKSVTQSFGKIDEELRRRKNIHLDKAREISSKMYANEMKQKGLINTREEKERQRSDLLNTFKFGTKSYQRYKKHHGSVQSIEDSNLVRIKNFQFFLGEAEREVKSPNKDEITNEYLENSNDTQSEEEFMHIMEKIVYKNMGIYPQNIRFKALNAVLEILADLEQNDQLLRVSSEELNKLFEIILPITEDPQLRMKALYISGNLLYRLTKFENMRLDRVASYIIACIMNQQIQEALNLLNQFDNDLKIWYKLKILLWISAGNMYEAENLIQELKKKFKVKFIHNDIYISLIQRYLQSENFERLEHWRLEFENLIKEKGFNQDKKSSKLMGKYVEASEQEKLEYLGQFGQVTSGQYLLILQLYLSNKQLNDIVPEMIEFYLKQPFTSVKDLQELLISFKWELSSKIRPTLENLSKKSAEKQLLKYVDDYQSKNPEIVKQEQFLQSFLQELAFTGGFVSITYIIENLIKNKQTPTEEHYIALIMALMKRKETERAYRVLTALEDSHSNILNEIENKGEIEPFKIEERLIPPVTPKIYSLYLKYFSTRKNPEEFNKILERIDKSGFENHPVILSTILKSLYMNNELGEALLIIDEILLNNIHYTMVNKTDYSFLGIYQQIWRIIRKILIENKRGNSSNIPDLRFLFMKMINDNTVPTSKLYNDIIDCFIRNNDFYGTICVIQYMGKVHRISPHKSTRSKIKKICNKLKYDSNIFKIYPTLHHQSRYSIISNNDKYYNAFIEMKKSQPNLNSSESSMDPFTPKDPIQESQDTRLQEQGEDTIDRAWKYLVTQMMRVLTVHKDFNRETLVQTHEDFNLNYECDKVVKEFEEWLKIPRLSRWEIFIENTKTLKEMDPLPDIDTEKKQ
ncbi:putative secreted protein [Wickerhamomyces ciferrii]|uniref:Secreted protein n=1 Tax=Wickerhamomyces ciferrii (strain ATCC 14091 / BCRC 22168 / CBS 111 / JCM 3599 / NBRC 0793 / NRRL Y-1031 F-60-10) TaxID=1206466 RepID=K0KNL0_WICCF|nr:uncharacterized protein BN7_2530 [Wickerhamomyces ciferrii]CCH42984.1 putative secreted protein [Wickerhamomyces ciferrii]